MTYTIKYKYIKDFISGLGYEWYKLDFEWVRITHNRLRIEWVREIQNGCAHELRLNRM